MKIKIAIVAAALMFMIGCETTGNTTGTSSTNNNPGNTSITGGISTAGATNPATTSTNARSTLTEGSTATGAGTTTSTSATTSTGTTISATTESANAANSSAMNSASTTTTVNGTSQAGTNNQMNQASAGVNNTASAGTAGSPSVPSAHQSAFTSRYPGAANVQWSRYNATDVPIDWELTGWTPLGNDDYVVRYNVGPDSYYTWYDSEGNWVGTSGVMKNTSALPAAINSMLANKYKGYTVSLAHTEYWKDRTAYEIEMKSTTTTVKVLVDANGNVIKEKIKTQ